MEPAADDGNVADDDNVMCAKARKPFLCRKNCDLMPANRHRRTPLSACAIKG